jgi:glycosyltransferase involved in cell wall biosynthesis
MCLNGLFLRDGRICERCKYGNFFSGWRFACYRESSLLSGLYALTIGAHRRWGTFARVDRFIALTSFVAEKLIESGVTDPAKISVLGNFLPEPLPDYGSPSSQETPYIVYVGRLVHEKGLWTLLETFRELRTVRLKILGTGPLMAEVQAYKHSHGLDHVELLGFIDGEEKYRILRGARGCVIPSEWYEVFPFSVLESAVVGTPVIVSRIGSLASLVSEGQSGLLFTPGDSNDLRAKLTWLMAHPTQAIQMGQRARQWVEAEHSAIRHYQALMEIYRKVIR